MSEEIISDFYLEYDEHLNKVSVLKKQQEDYEKSIREQQEERRSKEAARIRRIKFGGGNQLNYATQILIEKAIIESEDVRVSHYDLGFEDTTAGMQDATNFLNKLKNRGCFENFFKLADESFRITKVKISGLKKYQSKIFGSTLQNQVIAKRKETGSMSNLVFDFGKNSRWEIMTMIMLENFKFKMIRGLDTPYEFDFEKIGYTKTSDGKLIEKKFLKDFILVLAMNNGRYNIRGLNYKEKSIIHTRKKEAKTALMKTFGFNDDPFKYNREKKEYSTKFKIIPPTRLRTIKIKRSSNKMDSNNKFSDLEDSYNENTPSM